VTNLPIFFLINEVPGERERERERERKVEREQWEMKSTQIWTFETSNRDGHLSCLMDLFYIIIDMSNEL
jgi:hypothetical protein